MNSAVGGPGAETPVTDFAGLVASIDGLFPPGSAESWDRVGVVCGEPAQPVRRALLTVDVTPAIVKQARDLGIDAIVAHHPLLLRGVHGIDPRTPKGRMVSDLVRAGIGLQCVHTNGDIGPTGTVAALAVRLGLTGTRPLLPRPSAPLDVLVTYVPDDRLSAVVDALAAAGAGAIGDYDRCHFTSPGTGTFRPLAGATPFVGAVGEVTAVAEQRLEMVLPRDRRSAVVRALLAAHPYQEPAWDLHEIAAVGSDDTGLGRIGAVEPTTVGAFAEHVARRLPRTVTGVRIAGDLDRPVRTVAVQAGAGDDLLDRARELGADLYLTSDLRHHPVSEALCWQESPAVLDVAHWAAEWCWLPVLASLLRQAHPALEVIISELSTDPWSATVGGN